MIAQTSTRGGGGLAKEEHVTILTLTGLEGTGRGPVLSLKILSGAFAAPATRWVRQMPGPEGKIRKRTCTISLPARPPAPVAPGARVQSIILPLGPNQ